MIGIMLISLAINLYVKTQIIIANIQPMIKKINGSIKRTQPIIINHQPPPIPTQCVHLYFNPLYTTCPYSFYNFRLGVWLGIYLILAHEDYKIDYHYF